METISKEEVIEVLESARELLSDQSRWTLDHPAIDKNNNEVSPHSKHAVAWNIQGAISKSIYQKKDRYKTLDYYMANFYMSKLGKLAEWTFLFGGYHPVMSILFDQSNYRHEHIDNAIYEMESGHEYNYIMSHFNKVINPY